MSKRTLHEIYIGSALVISLVLMIAVKWESLPKLFEYITFAASLMSIILALIAIAYSYAANVNMDRNLSELNSSVNKINMATSSVVEISRNLQNDLKDSSSLITEKFRSVETNIEKINRSDASNIIFQKANETSDHYGSVVSRRLNIFDLAHNGSISGAMILYACAYSFKHGTNFNLNDLDSILSFNVDYMYGYLIASEACGAFDMVLTAKNKDVVIRSIDNIRDTLLADIDQIIQGYLQRQADDEGFNEYVTTRFNNLKIYLKDGMSAFPTHLEESPNS